MEDHAIAIDENENERIGVLVEVNLSECYAVWDTSLLSRAHCTYQKTLQMINAALQASHALQCYLRFLALLLVRCHIFFVRLDKVAVASEDVLESVSAQPITFARRARHVGG